MKTRIGLIIIAAALLSCNAPANKTDEKKEEGLPIVGTWQLISGALTEKNKTVTTDYTKNQKAIKIINGDHFCFLVHDLTKGKGATQNFSSGGGKYTLKGD